MADLKRYRNKRFNDMILLRNKIFLVAWNFMSNLSLTHSNHHLLPESKIKRF